MKSNQKMYSLKALFLLELNARFAGLNFKSAKGIIKIVLLTIFGAAGLYLYYYIARTMILSFFVYDQEKLFLALFLSIIGIALSVSGITSVEKSLFLSGNNELLLKYPVKDMDIFWAKIILQLIIMFVYNLIAQLPVYLAYGKVIYGDGGGAGFYLMIPVAIILSTIAVFLIATIFSVPFLRVKAFTRDKYILTLIISTIVVGLMFAIYMIAVQQVMNFMETETVSFFSEGIMATLINITKWIVPFSYIINMLVMQRFWFSFLIAFLAIAVLAVICALVIKKEYLNSIYVTVEMSGCSFEKKTKDVALPVFASLLRKDFYEILRSPNYSFQYLAMSLAAPIMTYFCARMAISVGSSALGEGLVPALSMLVILIFVTIMVSFSATTISRMGDAFYMTKTSPVPYVKQVLVKFVIYIAVAFLVILFSCLVLIVIPYKDEAGLSQHFVSFGTGMSMFGICLMFAIAEICMSMRMDINRPNFPVSDGDELTGGTPNTFISMFVGFIVSMVVGIAGIVGSVVFEKANGADGARLITFGGIAILAFLYMGSMVAYLFAKLEKAYYKIIPLR